MAPGSALICPYWDSLVPFPFTKLNSFSTLFSRFPFAINFRFSLDNHRIDCNMENDFMEHMKQLFPRIVLCSPFKHKAWKITINSDYLWKFKDDCQIDKYASMSHIISNMIHVNKNTKTIRIHIPQFNCTVFRFLAR